MKEQRCGQMVLWLVRRAAPSAGVTSSEQGKTDVKGVFWWIGGGATDSLLGRPAHSFVQKTGAHQTSPRPVPPLRRGVRPFPWEPPWCRLRVSSGLMSTSRSQEACRTLCALGQTWQDQGARLFAGCGTLQWCMYVVRYNGWYTAEGHAA